MVPVCLWVVQIQCICGIIINRIALLMIDRRRATKLKWTVAIILGLVNISVFCIWIPARLQISGTYVHINEIWDRIEKGIFLLVDAGLNLYFIFLVRTRLIANGLMKYMPLFKFNMFMVAVSMSLDVSSDPTLLNRYGLTPHPGCLNWKHVYRQRHHVRPARASHIVFAFANSYDQLHPVPPARLYPQATHRDEYCRAHCQGCAGYIEPCLLCRRDRTAVVEAG